MGWLRDALKELKAGRAAEVRPTGGPLRGRIEGGQQVTISPIAAHEISADDVVLVRWKDNPMLFIVRGVRDDDIAVGDTLTSTPLGWVPRDGVIGKVTKVQPLPEGYVVKPKSRTITFGLDTPNDYGPERVLHALGVQPLDASARSATTTAAAQVLFLPSFHPECCVTVDLRDYAPTVTLVTMRTSLWNWWCHQMQRDRGNLGPNEQPPPSPERWEERAVITTEGLAALRAELSLSDPPTESDAKVVTLDGMTVHAQYRDEVGHTMDFGGIIDSSDPRQRTFLLPIYRLACDLLHDSHSVKVLENIRGYLDLGLPVKWIEGSLPTIRIFGSLSSSDGQALRSAFMRLPEDGPLLVDMSNFHNMGTLLYPVFKHVLRRRGHIAWCATGHAKDQLKEIGVPCSAVFDDRVNAAMALGFPAVTEDPTT